MQTPARSRAKSAALADRSFLARKLGPDALRFVHTAELGGAVLLVAALVALIWANSPWRGSYEALLHTPISLQIGTFDLKVPAGGESATAEGRPADGMTLHHWINDGLMVIFFFVVGLEIKREVVDGELAGLRRASLPVVIALGGMIAPALIYVAFNRGGPNAAGWGVPMATDIAFALGALAILGDRVPAALRVILMAFAVADDLGAIAVIAVFYTESLSLGALGVAIGLVLLVLVMRRLGVLDIGPYLVVGVLLWGAMLVSGVHATIAGVVLGLLTPSKPWFEMGRYRDELNRLERELQAALDAEDRDQADFILGQIEKLTVGTESVLDRLVREIHPWSAFGVLPLFALANAGVRLDLGTLGSALTGPVFWGVFLGLLVGKPLGTTGLTWLAARAGLVRLPEDVTWKQMAGLGLLGGIGFTVALFITELAFGNPEAVAHSKLGILSSSLLATVGGVLYLRKALPRPDRAAAGGAPAG